MKKLILLQILTVISILMSLPIHAANIVTDGLVSYWTFDLNHINDGIVEDVWGENDARIIGDPKVSDGHVRQGLKFNGTGDYVILENTENFQSRTTPFSFEFMLKSTNINRPSTIFRVFETPCAKRSRGWGLDINATRTPMDFQEEQAIGNPWDGVVNDDQIVYRQDSIIVQFADKTRVGCNSNSFGFRSPITDGKWHHFVLVSGARYIDSTGRMWKDIYLYIDNVRLRVSRSRGTSPDDFVPFTQPVYLGATNNNGKAQRYYLHGSIDEVRIYNRAITHDEVTKNYASSNSLSVEPAQKLPISWSELKTRR